MFFTIAEGTLFAGAGRIYLRNARASRRAVTVLCIEPGESDGTDPLGQSQEMYRALRQEGVPVELVSYPREDHGPLAIGIFGRPSPEPWHGYDGRQRIIEFLNKAFGVTENQ